jgi:hypothetical protein
MSDLATARPAPRPLGADVPPALRHREGNLMLLHEALARSRQREAQEAARRYALARELTAGRTWAQLARFAARRADRARASAPSGRAVGGLRGAL